MQKILQNKLADLKALCSKLGVKKMYVFGSAVKGKFTEKSDIDFLISFTDKLSIEEYTENYFSLHYKLQELFKRKIDLVTESSLSNPYFIESVDESKQLIYEA
ncbi:nucleotidyltransferase domain-containing protein [Flammeovirga yaeyamensis]|uniref:Nucleotidyltransferase domain-containing protein n=1 Tax=Flammeovirga yaeyamensis TaxID=367791 RepID=A0AAX1N2W6_9BACT|nr:MULTISPECIES: nucleotidyltransferase domain-containing protein [Flammeovirga]ANQ50746.1 nucleotidyltransferase domain-containing protein [Flammeovirga sp. MY04]MBB3701084.1 hypothetical protein [Flammeovirga yaeyamensis]NMF38087.1 nucleotidyltransferase domain-containing protein [Flammeovirga yaeyamensis]QWG01859.1 nucleotidyltransferase domain-containing protein [Flammeovirga yaeyamensis]